MTKIRHVTKEDHSQPEGDTDQIPEFQAEEKFISSFKDKKHAKSVYEHVKEDAGYHTSDDAAWVIAMNGIIDKLNNLPNNHTEQDVKTAFGI